MSEATFADDRLLIEQRAHEACAGIIEAIRLNAGYADDAVAVDISARALLSAIASIEEVYPGIAARVSRSPEVAPAFTSHDAGVAAAIAQFKAALDKVPAAPVAAEAMALIAARCRTHLMLSRGERINCDDLLAVVERLVLLAEVDAPGVVAGLAMNLADIQTEAVHLRKATAP